MSIHRITFLGRQFVFAKQQRIEKNKEEEEKENLNATHGTEEKYHRCVCSALWFEK